MKSYLLFFGKSQDFTTHVFDNHDYIDDFNTIIKDFDLLESKIFTVDAIDNKEIFAKYHFKSREGKQFSLLKLYSFAQAYSGDRIAGSIFGVGLLSENDIALSKINLNVLKTAKDNFAKLCLNGSKFKSSDFLEEVEIIWNALITHKEGNFLEKVDFTNKKIFSTNNDCRGFYVKNLFEDILKLEGQMDKSPRIYVSDDLEHLKRTNNKFGNQFKIYVKTNNGFEKYEELKPIEQKNISILNNNDSKSSFNEQNLKHRIEDLEEENKYLSGEVSLHKKRSSDILLKLGILSSILFITTILFFFKSSFWTFEENNPIPPEVTIETEGETPQSESKININYILDDPASVDTLISFARAIKDIHSFNAKLNIKDSTSFYKKIESIQSKSLKLNISISNIEFVYFNKKNTLDSIKTIKKNETIIIKKEVDKKKKSNGNNVKKKVGEK
jgi:hypothetical protein